jgi:hypothetical protein
MTDRMWCLSGAADCEVVCRGCRDTHLRHELRTITDALAQLQTLRREELRLQARVDELHKLLESPLG